MKIILFQPEIPQNTGNIVRTCSVTNSSLILVEPLGFSITDRWLKRAGLDYWEGVDVQTIPNLEAYLNDYPHNFYFLSSKASHTYSDVKFGSNDALIFGAETSGLPDLYRERWPDRHLKVPMADGSRCLNLATTVGIVLYEAMRQQNFQFMN